MTQVIEEHELVWRESKPMIPGQGVVSPWKNISNGDWRISATKTVIELFRQQD